MNSLVFLFNPAISLKKKHLTFKISQRIKKDNRWLPAGPNRSLYFSDLASLVNSFRKPFLLKKIIEGELNIRKREGRFFSESDDISILRFEVNSCFSFLKQLNSLGLLCDQEGNIIPLKEPQPLRINFIRNNSLILLKLSVNNQELKDYSQLYESEYPIVFLNDCFCPLKSPLTKKFIDSLPLGNPLSEPEMKRLFKRIENFKSGIIMADDNKQKLKILENQPCFPVIRLSPNAQNANLFFEYPGNIIINANNTVKEITYPEKSVKLIRNIKEEIEYSSLFKKTGFIPQKTSDYDWYLPSSKTYLAIKTLTAECFDIKCMGKSVKTDIKLSFKSYLKNNQIAITPTLTADGKGVSAENLLPSLNSGSPFFSINDHFIAILNSRDADRLEKLSDSSQTSGSEFTIMKEDFGIARDLLQETETPPPLQKIFKIADKERIDSSIKDLPDNLQSTLRSYQKKGISWLLALYNAGFNGILADDMGLGKTIQTLSFLAAIYKNSSTPSLLVVPSSLIFNWVDEINKFTPFLRYLNHSGSNRSSDPDEFRKYDLVITSYALLRNDESLFQSQNWNCLFLDEAQAVKNPFSKTSRITKRLTSEVRLSITGTPVENSPLDLWNQFDFLMPGFLSKREDFIENYAAENNRKILKMKTTPFILRRMKDEVLKELPPKTEINIKTPMSPTQKKLYKDIIIKSRSKLSKESSSSSILEILLRLRQTACSPFLLSKNIDDIDKSEKTKQVMSFIEEITAERHKIIIFSQFTSHLKIFSRLMGEQNIPFHYLDGATRNREETIKNFKNDKKSSVFLISLKAGGQGLNLTEASYVFLLDPWWNPQVENQAIDRCYRIGQTKPVTIYRFISEKTIEENVLKLAKEKLQMEKDILSVTDGSKTFNKEEMINLINS